MDDMFNKMIRNNITPNQFYVLYNIVNSVNSKLVKNQAIEIKALTINGFLLADGKVSSKGKKFVKEVEGFFKRSKRSTSIDLMGQDFMDNIKKYREIWPKKVLKSNKAARQSVKVLEGRFRWFFENYDYSWDTIHKATKMYMQKTNNGNDVGTHCSMYFVNKKELKGGEYMSPLADYCEMIEDGFEGEKPNFVEHTFS